MRVIVTLPNGTIVDPAKRSGIGHISPDAQAPTAPASSKMLEVLALAVISAMSLGGVIAFGNGAPKVGYSLSAISTLATTILAAARLAGQD